MATSEVSVIWAQGSRRKAAGRWREEYSWTEKEECWWHAEQRRRNADDILNRVEGKLVTSEERRSVEQRRRKADDKWREEVSRAEKKESWWQVKRGDQLSREEGKLLHVRRGGQMNREEGKLMASEERKRNEQRRRNADGMLNREEGMLMTCWTEKKEDDDKWREGDSWAEKKESWWLVKRIAQLNREEGKLMTSEESRTAEQRRRKADDKWRE
jgi:hypothetical protein